MLNIMFPCWVKDPSKTNKIIHNYVVLSRVVPYWRIAGLGD